MSTNNFILMGDIGAAHGIKGWVRVRSFSEPREKLFDYGAIYQLRDGQYTLIEIEKKQTQGPRMLMKLAGINNRNDAERLTGVQLYIQQDALDILPDDEYYWHQLVGMRVIGADGETLGQVDSLLETGTHDVLVLKHQNKKRMIPFVMGDIVTRISQEAQEIHVHWTPEFFDES